MNDAIPEVLHLTLGEHWSTRLHGMGSAGYQWVCTVEGRLDVVYTKMSVLPLPEPPLPGGPPPPGSNADYLFEVYGQSPGRVTLHLTLRRSWETQHPIKHHQIEVQVG